MEFADPSVSLYLLSRTEAYRRAASFLPMITCKVVVERTDETFYSGSAVLYSDQYYFMTCYHVVKNAKVIKVTLPALGVTCVATTSFYDEKVDLAVLVGIDTPQPTHQLPYVALAPSVNQGDMIFCAGFRQGTDAIHFTEGIVSTSSILHSVIVTATTDKGTSGGPCVSAQNFKKMIGIIRGQYGDVQISTDVIPPLDIDNAFSRAPDHIPRPQIFML